MDVNDGQLGRGTRVKRVPKHVEMLQHLVPRHRSILEQVDETQEPLESGGPMEDGASGLEEFRVAESPM